MAFLSLFFFFFLSPQVRRLCIAVLVKGAAEWMGGWDKRLKGMFPSSKGRGQQGDAVEARNYQRVLYCGCTMSRTNKQGM